MFDDMVDLVGSRIAEQGDLKDALTEYNADAIWLILMRLQPKRVDSVKGKDGVQSMAGNGIASKLAVVE